MSGFFVIHSLEHIRLNTSMSVAVANEFIAVRGMIPALNNPRFPRHDKENVPSTHNFVAIC